MLNCKEEAVKEMCKITWQILSRDERKCVRVPMVLPDVSRVRSGVWCKLEVFWWEKTICLNRGIQQIWWMIIQCSRIGAWSRLFVLGFVYFLQFPPPPSPETCSLFGGPKLAMRRPKSRAVLSVLNKFGDGCPHTGPMTSQILDFHPVWRGKTKSPQTVCCQLDTRAPKRVLVPAQRLKERGDSVPDLLFV